MGAGGLIGRLRGQGSDVTVLVVAEPSEVRRVELLAAASVLRFYCRFGAQPEPLDGGHLHVLVDQVDGAVQQLKPDLVVMPAVAASHQDHRQVAEACFAALRPAGGTRRWRPPFVWAMEYSADHWSLYGPQRPDVFISLTEDLVDRKVAAMEAHASQCRPCPSERSPEAIRALCRLRGSQAGVPWAEAFESRRMLL